MSAIYVIGFELGAFLFTIGLTLLIIPKSKFEQLQQSKVKVFNVGVSIEYFIERLIEVYFSKYAGYIFIAIHIITLLVYLKIIR